MESNGLLPERWTAVQESIARLAGIALLTFDGQGALRSAARSPEFCRLLAATPEGARRCAAWCERQRARAGEERRCVFFRCHAGLHCFAAPVSAGAGAGAAGVLLGGFVLEKAADVERAAGVARELALPGESLRRSVGSLPFASAAQLHRAAELAACAAGALCGGERLLAAERSRTALLDAILALGEDFAREREPHEVCATLLDAAAILLDVRGACLLVRDERTGLFRPRAAIGAPPPALPAAGLRGDGALLAPVLRERAPLVVAGPARCSAQGLPPGTRAAALVPLCAGERVLAVLCVVDTELDAGQSAALAALCRQAALALSNARLREQLARRTREIERAEGVRERFAPLQAWDEVIDAVLEEAVRQAGAREASLMLLDRRARSLRVARARGERSTAVRAVTVAAGEGIAGRVAAEGRPLLVEEIGRDERLRRPGRPRYRTGSFLVVPLRVRRRVIGVINLADKEADAPFSPEDLDAVLTVTAHASGALQRAALHGRVRELREQAATDPLTGLANRRFLEARLREEAGRTGRSGAPFALSMIDLDDFKGYNDREGHPAGDALLAAIARVMRAAARDSDLVARYGGDEFAILSPGTRAAEAMPLLERIRAAVAAHRFGLPGLPETGGITLSAGVASFPEDAGAPDSVLRAADAALYRAKALGRARVVRAAP